MRRRLLTPLLVLALLLGLYLAPALPPVRERLLAGAHEALADAGWELTWDASSGNPWNGIRLRGATVRAPGVDVAARELQVGWFLPGLITGELPLSVRVRGLTGALDPAEIALPAGGGGAPPVRPVLRRLELAEVELEVAAVTASLPDLTVERVQAQGGDDGVRFAAEVSTPDGRAQVEGEVRLDPWAVEVTVVRADAAIARHWWDGLRGGTLRGVLRADADGVAADARLQDGSLEFLDVRVDDIEGPLRYRHPRIEAELAGRSLGGPVTAVAGVDVAERRWWGELAATPGLEEGAGRLLRDAPLGPEALDLAGAAHLELRAEGWRRVALEGTASAEGRALGQPLRVREGDLRFTSEEGLELHATALLGEGALAVALGPSGGPALTLRARSLPLPGGLEADGELELDSLSPALDGRFRVEARGPMPPGLATAPSGPLRLALDGTVDADGWQGFLSGDLGPAPVEGAVVLRRGRLAAGATVRELPLAGLTGSPDVILRADGPLSALRLRLALAGEEAVTLDAGPFRSPVDLRGALGARLEGRELKDVEGAFGPLSLSGGLELAPGGPEGALDVRVARTPLAAPVATSLRVPDAEILLGDGGATVRGELELGAFDLAGARADAMRFAFELDATGPLTAELRELEGRILARLGPEGTLVELAGPPLVLRDEPLSLDGTVALPPGGGLAAARIDLAAETGGVAARAEGTGDAVRIAATAEPGAAALPLALRAPLELEGTADLTTREGEGRVTLGELELRAVRTVGRDGARWSVTGRRGGERFEVTVDRGGVRAEGELALEPLGAALGLELAGRLRGDLRRVDGALTGEATLAWTGGPIAADLRLAGTGGGLRVDGVVEAVGGAPDVRAELSGTLLPSLALRLDGGPLGEIRLADDRLSGGGTLPSLPAGLTLEERSWRLEGDLAARRAEVVLGDSRAELRWDGALRADATLAATGTVLGEPWRLTGDAAYGPGAPRGRVDLEADVAGGTVAAAGPLGGLELHADLPWAELLPDAAEGLEPRGRLRLEGRADAFAREVRLEGAVVGAGDGVAVEAELTPNGIDARAVGAGLEVSYGAGTLRVAGQDGRPAALLGALPPSLRLDGELRYEPGAAAWGGEARLTLEESGLEAALTLRGEGERLVAEVTGAAGAAVLAAEGELAPGLRIAGQALAGPARADFELTGPHRSPSLGGTLRTEELRLAGGRLVVPAQSFGLQAGTTEGGQGFSAVLVGPGGALRLTPAGWDGSVGLAPLVGGLEHRLVIVAEGDLARPRLEAELTGPLARGTVLAQGGPAPEAVAEVELEPAALAAGIPAGVGPVRASATARPSGAWTLSASAPWALPGGVLRAAAELTGTGTTYDGTMRLLVEDAGGPERTVLAATLAGAGRDARLTTDLGGLELAALDPLLPVSLAGSAQGELVVGTTEGLVVDAVVDAEVAGRATQLRATRRPDAPLALTLEALGATLRVRGEGPVRLELSAPDADLIVGGEYLRGAAPELTLAGALRGDALALATRVEAGRLRVDARYRDATLAATAGLSGELPLQLEVRDPQGSLLGVGARLALAGPLAGPTALEGALTLAADGAGGEVELPVQLRAGGDAGALEIAYEGLTLEVRRDASGVRADLRGSATLPPLGAPVVADLAWTSAGGFAGAVSAGPLDLDGLDATATARGGEDGGLRLEARAGRRGEELVRAEARLGRAPWRDGTLRGHATLSADLADAVPAAPLDLRAGAELELSGTLREPRLEGAAALSGALEASGSLRAGPDGAELRLEGTGLTLDGSWDGNGWRAVLRAEDAPVAVGELAVRMDGVVEARAAAGGVAAATTGLELRTRSSVAVLRGSLEPVAGLDAAAELELALGDLPLGPALGGRLSGALALTGAPASAPDLGALRGTLELSGVGPAAGGPALGGVVVVGGTAGAPMLELDLHGQGAAAGTLTGRLEPASRAFRLRSDLRYGPLATDLEIVYRERLVTARGGAAFGDAALRIVEADPAWVRLGGAGTLAGWDGLLELEPARLLLEGPLDELAGPLAGALKLELGGDGWLEAETAGLELAGRDLGELRLTAPEPAGPYRLEGRAVSARFAPAGLAWELERLELPLLSTLSLSASGAGRGTDGALRVALGGGIDGATADLRAQVELAGGRAALRATGSVAGGDVSLYAVAGAEDGWSGRLAWSGARWGAVRGNLAGEIAGPLLRPTFRGRVEADAGGARLGGALTASAAGVDADLAATAPWLGEGLAASGSLWPEPALRLEAGGEALDVRVDPGGTLRVEGGLELPVGPLRLALEGRDDGGAALRVEAAALPGLELVGALPPLALAALDEALPLALEARGSGEGRVVLEASPLRLRLEGLRYRASQDGEAGDPGQGLDLFLDGALALAPNPEGTLQGSVGIPPGLRAAEATPERIAFTLRADEGGFRLHSDGEAGRLDATLGPAADEAALTAALRIGEGAFDADVSWRRGVGPSGRATAVALPLPGVGPEGLRLDGEVTLTPAAVLGTLQIEVGEASVRASGAWGLAGLPDGLVPEGGTERRLDVRIGAVPVESLPPLAARLPHLTGAISGVAQLRGDRIVGQLVAPELRVVDTTLPTEIEFNGSSDSLSFRATVDGSPVQLTWTPERLAGVATLRGFPLEALAEAVAGPVDVEADLSAVARIDLPLGGDGPADLRIATEGLRLERDGVVTTGRVSLDYFGGALTIRHAEFRGAGTWRAEGVIRPDDIDFSLVAEDADFTPMLGLVPRLAALRAGARGDLTVRAEGSFARPRVRIATDGLELALAGADYRLTGAEAALVGTELSVAARVEGLEPLTGALDVTGEGRLRLAPLRLDAASVAAEGAIEVPILGRLEDLEADIAVPGGAPPTVEARGLLGRPFTVRGTLAPFDVRAEGQDLALRAPPFLLASSRSDVDVGIRWEDGRLILTGGVSADQARFELGIRPQREGPPERIPFLERVVLDDIRIRAPQQVRFEENFGAAELALDLTLAGTAATPTLAGAADALRGTLRFASRDFEIVSARAVFDPTRGVYPVVEVQARTSFEKARVLPPGGGVDFVTPREGSRFEVVLSFRGEVEATPHGPRAYSLDIEPELTSDARIRVEAAAGPDAAPRALTDAELVSLLTLGRLELSPVLAGQGGLAGVVAQGALDTAVDLLLVSELQTALSEALGVDVVEIRTTALSSILGGVGEDPFSVSLRLGGYLEEGLFASYRIGRFDDEQGLYALTNELSLTYELGPLDLNLAGRVNFGDTRLVQPEAELSVELRYQFDGRTSLETGLDLSDDSQQVRFGISLRF